jgi:hypothetical protein
LAGFADASASAAFGVGGALCTYYSAVLAATPASDIDDVDLCLFRIPSGDLLIRAFGHNLRRTIVWVVRAVLADVGATAVRGACGNLPLFGMNTG